MTIHSQVLTSFTCDGMDTENLNCTFIQYVTDWHTMFLVEFNAAHVTNYIKNPALILSELEELVAAIKDDNAVEVFDAILDILWEIIPVNRYLAPYLEVVEGLLGETNVKPIDMEVDDTVDFLPIDLRGAIATVLGNLYDLQLTNYASLNTTFAYLRTLETLLFKTLKHLDPSYNAVRMMMEQVVNSNFSKAVPTKAWKDEMAGEYSPRYVTFKGESYIIVVDGAGKIKKPVGHFFSPNLLEHVTPELATKTLDFFGEVIPEDWTVPY